MLKDPIWYLESRLQFIVAQIALPLERADFPVTMPAMAIKVHFCFITPFAPLCVAGARSVATCAPSGATAAPSPRALLALPASCIPFPASLLAVIAIPAARSPPAAAIP